MLNGENRLRVLLRRFFREEDGATMIEYGLIVAVISVGIIAGMRGIGSNIDTVFQLIIDTLAPYTG